MLVDRTLVKDMWVRPSSNFRRQQTRAIRENISPTSGQRFLELADVALGTRKSSQQKKKAKPAVAATLLKRKTSPYSS
jgi:hypothetical protein